MSMRSFPAKRRASCRSTSSTRCSTSGQIETRRRAEEWLSSFRGPIGLEIRGLSVTVGDDVAFAHGLNRVSGTMADGQAIGMWLRSTVCFRKIDGQWTVTHQHSSVPLDGESGRASLELKP